MDYRSNTLNSNTANLVTPLVQYLDCPTKVSPLIQCYICMVNPKMANLKELLIQNIWGTWFKVFFLNWRLSKYMDAPQFNRAWDSQLKGVRINPNLTLLYRALTQAPLCTGPGAAPGHVQICLLESQKSGGWHLTEMPYFFGVATVCPNSDPTSTSQTWSLSFRQLHLCRGCKMCLMGKWTSRSKYYTTRNCIISRKCRISDTGYWWLGFVLPCNVVVIVYRFYTQR